MDFAIPMPEEFVWQRMINLVLLSVYLYQWIFGYVYSHKEMTRQARRITLTMIPFFIVVIVGAFKAWSYEFPIDWATYALMGCLVFMNFGLIPLHNDHLTDPPPWKVKLGARLKKWGKSDVAPKWDDDGNPVRRDN